MADSKAGTRKRSSLQPMQVSTSMYKYGVSSMRLRCLSTSLVGKGSPKNAWRVLLLCGGCDWLLTCVCVARPMTFQVGGLHHRTVHLDSTAGGKGEKWNPPDSKKLGFISSVPPCVRVTIIIILIPSQSLA